MVVEFEVDVLDDEGPDFIAESVGVQVALYKKFSVSKCAKISRRLVP